MMRRFKTKSKRNYMKLKIFLILFLIYISFSFVFRFLYKNYIKKMSHDEIVNHILVDYRNNVVEDSFLAKYKSPEFIMKYTLDLDISKKEEDLEVINDVVEPEEQGGLSNLVYIYSTHEKEEYKDLYLENYNIAPSVKTVSYILQDSLKDLGIGSIIETESVTDILKNNSWSYSKSYDASRQIALKRIEANDSLKLVIDLHRDSSNLNKTLLEYDNKKYARVLFVVGAEYDNYEINYKLANTLSDALNAEIPGLSRGVVLKSGVGVNGVYNQDLTTFSVLIEMGGQYNQIDELNNSSLVLAKVILKYLEGEI